MVVRSRLLPDDPEFLAALTTTTAAPVEATPTPEIPAFVQNISPPLDAPGAMIGKTRVAAGVRKGRDLILYVDGVEQARRTVGKTAVNTLTVRIGAAQPGTIFVIDDVQRFDRALTPDELAHMPEAGRSTTVLSLRGSAKQSQEDQQITSSQMPLLSAAEEEPAQAPEMPLLAARGPTPVAVSKYYYVNGQRVAQSRNGVLSWIHSDHLHSATVMTDLNGNEVRWLAYKAFGEETQNTGSGAEPPYTYTGKELDNTGLMYYGARYYDPVLCRFVTPDTVYDVGPQGLNRYSYALNNPVRYHDPSGHATMGEMFAQMFGNWQWPGADLVWNRMQAEAQGATSGAVEGATQAATIYSSIAVPGVGEALDVQVLMDSGSTRNQKIWAGASLLLSAVTMGIGPNYGAIDDTLEAGARGTVREAGETTTSLSSSMKALPPVRAASELREMPGLATGGQNLPEIRGKWLRGTDGNAGRIPKRIADQLRGREFRDFAHFREEFWKAIANDPTLSSQFIPANRKLMADGNAPFVVGSQVTGLGSGDQVYNLHHITPIEEGGSVYDLDNIMVTSPRYHKGLHSK